MFNTRRRSRSRSLALKRASQRGRKLCIEALEDRLALTWAGTPPATIYLDEPELLAFADAATGVGVHLMSPPAIMHVDSAGQFGPAGEAEWMAFLNDPAGNTIGLVARRPA